MQYVARQPILDSRRELYAYELLFRDSLENFCPPGDPELASKRTMDTALVYGIEALSEGHTVFLNCTHDVVVKGFPTLFPADLTIVEILETAQATRELIDACKELKDAGYRIALDDFVVQPGYEPLIKIADVIKVDFRASSPEECRRLAAAYGGNGRVMLAEKVETEEEFRSAKSLGFGLFQGYFFARPRVFSTETIERLDTNQISLLRILGQPRLDYVELEEVIKADPALCYRLLRFLNSPAFYLQGEVRSILHALTLLGEDDTRKWLLLASAVLGLRNKNPHLLTMALVRARFAELLGPQTRLSGSSLFILGLLSLMDGILNMSKEAVAEKVATSDEIRAALKGEPNPLGRCLELVQAFEAADWENCERLRKNTSISEPGLSQYYFEAVEWATHISKE
jgi:EAL and modified HD-GYP domain-containing signal transduction protein